MPDIPATTGKARLKRRVRIALILLAGIGCGISLVLIRLSVSSGTPATIFGTAVCSPTNAVDCDYVLRSRWARWGPVPVSAFGLAYFAAVAAWFAVVGLPNATGRHWHRVPLAMVSIGLCASLRYMYIMAMQLPVWCTWCVAAHIINAMIFALVLLARPRRPAVEAPAAGPQTPYPSNTRALAVIGTAAALGLLIVVTAVAYRAQVIAWRVQERYLAVTNDIDYIEWRCNRAPRHDLPVRPDDVTLGHADATFTIVAFTDFECPKCKAFLDSAPALMERFPGTLRFVFKHFPIASACNPHAPANFHYFSCEAALAAEAARRAGSTQQAIGYHRALYANMSRLDARPYRSLAVRIGIDPDAFSAALEDAATRTRLDEDIALAHRLGVKATPAIFLNGRRLPTWSIVTPDPDHKLDVEKTVELWERLLGEKAKRQPARPSQ